MYRGILLLVALISFGPHVRSQEVAKIPGAEEESVAPDSAVEPLNLQDAAPPPERSVVFLSDFPDNLRDSTLSDSLPRPVQRKLLPDNMSFLERGLWGEHGLVRGIDIASPLTPEVRKHELAVRRTMLTMHQIGGFVTLGLMGAAVVYGQRSLDHLQRRDRELHQTYVTATIISYSATALLAVLSPPPLIRREGESSTTTLHKTLAWIHAAGMIATPLLGAAINRRGASFRDQARVHQIAAYITTSVFAASFVVVTF